MTPPPPDAASAVNLFFKWTPTGYSCGLNSSFGEPYRALPAAAFDALLAERDALKRFVEVLFSAHWDGTIGRAETWHLRGDFRHVLAGMRGASLIEAIRDLLARVDALLATPGEGEGA